MIEVGEYVRTKSGEIGIFNKYFEDKQWFEMKKTDNVFYGIPVSAIIKHSKIVSEVVEIGDYVNGKRIHKIDKGQNYCYLYYGNCKTFVDYQIKTILTKELYQSNCYTVERKEKWKKI